MNPLLRHIRACHNHDPAATLPLWCGDQRIGLVRRDNAAALRAFPEVFTVGDDRVALHERGDADATSRAVDPVVDALVAAGAVAKWRNERFDVAPRWGDPPLFRLDRGAVAFFGVRAYGVHLNGFRRIGGRLHLWVGRRAADKRVAPDKLDNVVAGGIASGYGAAATLAKEAGEEASIPPALIARAHPVGALAYRMASGAGIRDDVLFVYDLELPDDFVPRNSDGEFAGFELMPAEVALERVRDSDDFKFNVNLVIIDFAIRHGLLAPDAPDYLEIAGRLRALPF